MRVRKFAIDQVPDCLMGRASTIGLQEIKLCLVSRVWHRELTSAVSKSNSAVSVAAEIESQGGDCGLQNSPFFRCPIAH